MTAVNLLSFKVENYLELRTINDMSQTWPQIIAIFKSVSGTKNCNDFIRKRGYGTLFFSFICTYWQLT